MEGSSFLQRNTLSTFLTDLCADISYCLFLSGNHKLSHTVVIGNHCHTPFPAAQLFYSFSLLPKQGSHGTPFRICLLHGFSTYLNQPE